MKKAELIKDLANKFRLAIEGMEIEKFPDSDWFKNFPRGCCGDASDLLAKYLSTHGIETVYVWGKENQQTHGWLEHDGIIIDITADQFPDIQEKVFVTKNRTWHSKFNGQSTHDPDFEKFNRYNRGRLSTIYSNILKHL